MIRAAATALVASLAATTIAQPSTPPPERPDAQDIAGAIEPSSAIVRLLQAPHLDDDARREVRLFHGMWEKDDLSDPSSIALVARTTGDFANPAIVDPALDAVDRAEGHLLRGELKETLVALAGETSLRAIRVRAEALALLGRHEDADAALDVVVDRMSRQALNPAGLTDGTRALMLRARLRGPERAANDFHDMMRLLARARELDRLYWPSRLAEAELLVEKSNWEEAGGAIEEVLRLNPRCADAWLLAGEMAIGAFDFDRAKAIADHLFVLEPESVHGHLLMARLRLQQEDLADAPAHLRAILTDLPRLREAMALDAAVAAADFDETGTTAALEAYERLSPGAAEPYLEVGRILALHRQYGEAAHYLEEAVARRPKWAEPVIELGLLEMQSGRDERALSALRDAVALDPFNKRAENSLTLIHELLGYETVETPHFLIRYRDGVDGVLANEMADVLEEIHEDVAGAFDFEPPVRTVVELMPDHRWFAVRIAGITRIHTMAASTGPVIAFESPREGPNHLAGAYDWARVFRHEYTHTVTLALTKNRIPHWFTEAAAVYMENAPRDEDTCHLLAEAYRTGTLFPMDRISIMFIRPRTPRDRSQAYAQSSWIYEFLIDEFGADVPAALMIRFRDGMTQTEAFDDVLAISQDDFMEAFLEWASGELVAWGMLPPEGMPTISEIVMMDAAAGVDDADEEDDAIPFDSPGPDRISGWLARWPEHPELLAMRLDALLEQDPESDETIHIAERLVEARPVAGVPRRVLARHHLDIWERGESDGQEAIEHLEFLDVREVTTPTFATQLARLHAARGDWPLALRKAERAVLLSPFDADYRELAATVAIRAKSMDVARHHLLALTHIEPDREIHRQRLEALERLGG